MIDPEDTVTRPLPQATRLRFASDDRIYNAVLTQDLLEDWIVVQSWGGKITQVESFEAGLALLQSIAKTREKRG